MKYISLFKREYTVQYVDNYIRSTGIDNFNKHICKLKTVLCYPSDKMEVSVLEENNLNCFLNSIIRYFGKDLEKFQILEDSLKKYGQKYVLTAKFLSKQKIKNKKTLIKDYKKYFLIWEKYSSYLTYCHFLNDELSDRIGSLIVKRATKLNKNKRLSIFLDAVFTPRQKSELAKLKEMVLKNKNIWLTKNKLLYLTKKYAWIACLDLQFDPWNEKDIEHFVKSLKKPEKQKVITIDKLAKELNLSARERDLVLMQIELAYLKDLRDDFRRKGVFYSRNLFRNIADATGYTYDEVIYMTKDEIVDLLNKDKQVDKKVLKKRRDDGFFMQIVNKQTKCLVGNEAKKAMKRIGLFTEKEETAFLQGTPASLGFAKGKVKIVKITADLKKVEEGDILIAVSTHPEYVTAMYKASAVVTDEGGLTCHAAIVCREIKTPCIVGVKNGTEVLKDGDLVEVDANFGIVKKIV